MGTDTLQLWGYKFILMLLSFSCLLMLLLYKLHSSTFADGSVVTGERSCNSSSNCSTEAVQNTTAPVPTTARPLTVTVVAVIAAVLGLILLVLLIVCTVALVVCLKRKQERMKREVIGNLYNYLIQFICVFVCYQVSPLFPDEMPPNSHDLWRNIWELRRSIR